MALNSRLPGFYKLSIDERRRSLSAQTEVALGEIERAISQGGMDAATADKIVENVIGTYGLPFGLALNVQINGHDRLAPMVVEEPSVIAAASNAAKMIRTGGGFTARVDESLMISQIEITDVADVEGARERLLEQEAALLEAAADAVPGLVRRGGGPRAMEVRQIADDHMVVHILVDCLDAMGANLVNNVAEALGSQMAGLAGGQVGLRILSNLADRRCVRVTCRVPVDSLALSPRSGAQPVGTHAIEGDEVARAIESASRFAERDPYRASTHNKGIMNGVDSVVIATGNDYRAVEAGAHAYAARRGRYEPLATWRHEDRELLGELEMPMALGIVGGTLRVHPAARLALRLAQIQSANELAMLAASVGLASNLAALRALATEGIQRGHMSLHARSVAAAAGAEGNEVERIAHAMSARHTIDVATAQTLLKELRETGTC